MPYKKPSKIVIFLGALGKSLKTNKNSSVQNCTRLLWEHAIFFRNFDNMNCKNIAFEKMFFFAQTTRSIELYVS